MTDELEWRLHAMLSEHAAQVEPALTGAELRRRAGRDGDLGSDPVERPTTPVHRTRRAAAMLAAAAAVVALALAAANFDGGRQRPAAPVPAGGVSAPPHTDAPSTAAMTSPARPTVRSTAAPNTTPARPGVSIAPVPRLVQPSGRTTSRPTAAVLLPDPSSTPVRGTVIVSPSAPRSTR